MVEGSESEQYHLPWSLLDFSHFPCFPQANWALWCWFPGEWVCVCSKTLWVSLTNSSSRRGIFPTTATPTPTGFYSPRFWGFISLGWNPGLCGLSHSPVVPSSLFAWKCGNSWSTSPHFICLSPPAAALPSPFQLPVSTPPTSLGECFFFNSEVVGLPYSLIFWQFWLFFDFKFVVLLFVVWEGKFYLYIPDLGWSPVFVFLGLMCTGRRTFLVW